MSASFNSSCTRCLAILLLIAAVPSVRSDQVPSSSLSSLDGYAITPFSIPANVNTVHLIDLNADTRQDFILEFSDELRIVHQDSNGFNLSKYQSIPIPRSSAIWDIARLSPEDESFSILVLSSDSNLTIWKFSDGLYQSNQVLVPVPAIHLPTDTNRTRFCIDINGDSIDDLALPTTHFLYVLELGKANQFLRTSRVPLLSSSQATIAANQLAGNVGQRYSASSADFRDIDNDSQLDVVMQNDSAVRIALGKATETGYFSSIPDYEVNYEKDSQKINFDSIDFSNLFALFRFAPNRVQIMDVNQDQLVDLIILEPNRVLTYIANESGIDTRKPTQVIRLNENTVVGAIADINGDGTSDLVAVKTPHVSVRKVLLTLVVPASLKFEMLVFHQTKGMYSRRPDSRLLINVRVPALLPMIVRSARVSVRDNEVSATISRDGGGSTRQDEPPAPVLDAQLDDVYMADLIAIESDEVRVYFNAIEESVFADLSQFDDMLDILKDKREVSIDIGKVLNSDLETISHQDLIADVEPVVIHHLESDQKYHDLLRFRLNDDNLDDIMIFEDRRGGAITGVLLLSQEQ